MNPKVLIIDNEPLVNKSTAMFLRLENIEAVTAENGEKGIALARSQKPDLILLDVSMPGMDGWEVLATLKKDVELKSIPAVMFTAGIQTDVDAMAQERGAAGTCSKPFLPAQLLNIVRKHLGHGFDRADGDALFTIDGYTELLREFVVHMDLKLPNLDRAIANKDGVGIGALAHTIKGLAGNLRVAPIYRASIKLEEALCRNDFPVALSLSKEIDAVVKEVRELLG